jgi:hypothetical protein
LRRDLVLIEHKEHLIFRGNDRPMSELMLSILGGVAEFERQREGVPIAQGKDVYRGRKSALTLEQVNAIHQPAATKLDRVPRKIILLAVTLGSKTC